MLASAMAMFVGGSAGSPVLFLVGAALLLIAFGSLAAATLLAHGSETEEPRVAQRAAVGGSVT